MGIVWSRWDLVDVNVVRKDTAFTSLAIETVVVPVYTSLVERARGTCKSLVSSNALFVTGHLAHSP